MTICVAEGCNTKGGTGPDCLEDGNRVFNGPMDEAHVNVTAVEGILAALRRGDASALLDALSDDVEWEFGLADHGIAWLTPGRGKQHVQSFFRAMQQLEVRRFSVLSVLGAGNWVVVLLDTEFVVRATGKHIFEANQPMLWKFDDDGRVIGVRHAADTHQHYLAAQPDD